MDKRLWLALTGADEKVELQVPVPPGREIAVGSDSDCALLLAGRDAPARVVVLVPGASGGHRLHFREDAQLKVKLGDGRILEGGAALAASGAAEKIGDAWELPIDEQCRGYLEVAGRKLIFKFESEQ
jgi:hypothetical protein